MRNVKGEWGIAARRGGGGIGFRPTTVPRTCRYTASEGGLRVAVKIFTGRASIRALFGEYTGSVLARKLGRARILAGIMQVRALCGVC